MERIIPSAIMLALAVIAIVGMWLSWRARGRRQSAMTEPQPLRAAADAPAIEAAYVATTAASDPLDRIVAHDLGFRGNARVLLLGDAIGIDRDGSASFTIPGDRVRRVGSATWTIDRVVESDGLLAIEWLLGETPVTTYLRPRHASDMHTLLTELGRLAPAPAGQAQD